MLLPERRVNGPASAGRRGREISVSRFANWLAVLIVAASGADRVAAAPTTAVGAAAVKAEEATSDRDAGRIRSRIYRHDPLTGTLVAVEPIDVRPSAIYSQYDPARGRWVWSKAAADRSLRYSIGPGSIQQVRSFDLQGTAVEQRRALEKQAPELARLLNIQGVRPTLKLDPEGRWQLGPTPHVSSVFDEGTGERWEWHHDKPSAVIHTCGRLWSYADGMYRPVR